MLPLVSLRSIHEYKTTFEEMASANCSLKFKYVSSRNNIDETSKCHEEDFKKMEVVDRSGLLYNIERNYDVVVVRYHKRFFYCDHAFKGTVEAEFDQFIEKCQKKYEGGQKRGLLRGRGKI